ncbi:MAG: alanine racemase [Christensenellaceae bacterium]|nr:alanine racemase [Christensenellaceae bacterium]
MYSLDETARAWAEIDLKALKHNLDYAKQRVGRKVICVLKADAYGHGAVECGRYLQQNGADMFAVAALSEAVELRENGITIPILILGYTPAVYADILGSLDIQQTVIDEAHAYDLNESAKECGQTVKVHIKLDTGMSRSGIYAQANHNLAIDAAERIYSMSNLDAVGMYTHFAAADNPAERDYTTFQYRNYSIVYNGLAERGIRIENCHVSNSAAILNSPIHFDSIREGIMLYGMYPDSLPVEDGVLRPVMTLKARVAQVRDFPAGTTVGYGRTYRSDTPFTSAVITAGYADGYPRRLSNKSYVVINGSQYPQIGRICMDVHMADVTGGNVKQGDEVVLFGNGGMSIESVAQIVGTINYELTCLVTERARRVYIK